MVRLRAVFKWRGGGHRCRLGAGRHVRLQGPRPIESKDMAAVVVVAVKSANGIQLMVIRLGRGSGGRVMIGIVGHERSFRLFPGSAACLLNNFPAWDPTGNPPSQSYRIDLSQASP